MPFSIDPQPADDELECARCGAHFFYGLTRCPNCGVNIYEPDQDEAPVDFGRKSLRRPSLGEWLNSWFHRLTKKPYKVDMLFGAALNQAELYDNLLTRVGGDRQIVERLIDLERQSFPGGNRIAWLQSAIQHWEKDNRTTD
jgi:hypothetical protein